MDEDLYAHYEQMLIGTCLKVQKSKIRREPTVSDKSGNETSFKQGEMKGLFLTEDAQEDTHLIVERPLICWLHPAYVKEIYADALAEDQKKIDLNGTRLSSRPESQLNISQSYAKRPSTLLNTTVQSSLASCAVRVSQSVRYCFNCLSVINGSVVYCKHRKGSKAPECRHEYCSDECRERHYVLGHVALCISLWPSSAKDILDTIRDITNQSATFSAYSVLEMIAQIICKEIAYLTECQDEALSLQYAYMHYAYMEPGCQARQTQLSSFRDLPNKLFQHITSICEYLVPDISFGDLTLLLTRATLLSPQMFDYLVCILLTNCYTIDNGDYTEIGAGLYTVISCCNHSCVPNAQVIFEDTESAREATLVLLRSCAKDEELFISYITDLGKPAIDRRQDLAQWGFSCQCSRCLEEIPHRRQDTVSQQLYRTEG